MMEEQIAVFKTGFFFTVSLFEKMPVNRAQS